jgi:hypothetical protein
MFPRAAGSGSPGILERPGPGQVALAAEGRALVLGSEALPAGAWSCATRPAPPPAGSHFVLAGPRQRMKPLRKRRPSW